MGRNPGPDCSNQDSPFRHLIKHSKSHLKHSTRTSLGIAAHRNPPRASEKEKQKESPTLRKFALLLPTLSIMQ